MRIGLFVTLIVVLMIANAPAAAPPVRRVDFLGDPLPPGAVARFGTIRWQHSTLMSGPTFSRDGQSLIVSDRRGVTIWETSTGKAKRWIRIENTRRGPLQLSRDEKLLLVGHRLGVTLHEFPTGKILRRFDAPQLSAVALSPLGDSLVIGTSKGTLNLYEARTGKLLDSLIGHTRPITALAFSPDAKTLASGEDFLDNRRGLPCQVLLWDVARKSLRRRLTEHPRGVWQLHFSPDSALLVVRDHHFGQTRVWDVAAGKLVRVFGSSKTHSEPFAFTSDGLLAIREHGDTIRVWNPRTWKEQHTIACSPKTGGEFAYSPCGKLVATHDAGAQVALLDASTGQRRLDHIGESAEIHGIAVSPDERYVAALRSGGITLWDAKRRGEARILSPARNGFWGRELTFADGGRIVIAAPLRDRATSQSVLRFWDVESGKEQGQPIELSGFVDSLSVDPTGQLVALTIRYDGVRLWDVRTRKELPQPKHAASSKDSLAHWTIARFSRDGKALFAVAHGSVNDEGEYINAIRSWDLQSGTSKRMLIPGRSSLGLTTATDRRTALVVDAQEGMVFRSLGVSEKHQLIAPTWKEGMQNALFSPDGKLLVSRIDERGISEFRLEVREVLSGQLITTVRDKFLVNQPVAFSLDGRRLYCIESTSSVLAWDLLQLASLNVSSQPGDSWADEKLWEQLADEDARVAFRAAGILGRRPREAVQLMSRHLPPNPPYDVKRLRQSIVALDDEVFENRTKAAQELRALGWGAEPELREAASKPNSLETRRAAAKLLALLNEFPRDRESRRQSRAVQLLAWLGTPESEALLRRLAEGAPGTHLTRDAQDALERIDAARGRQQKAAPSVPNK